MSKRFRSSVSGAFVTADEAAANPRGHVAEAREPSQASGSSSGSSAFERAVLDFCEAVHSALVLSPDVSRGDKGRLDATIKELRAAVRAAAR